MEIVNKDRELGSMPSWNIHIGIAEEILRRNKGIRNADEFIMGNLLPDVLNGHTIEIGKGDLVAHSITHREDIVTRMSKLRYDYALGYVTHVITDQYWNNWLRENKYEYDELGRICRIKDVSGRRIKANKEIGLKMKHTDLRVYGVNKLPIKRQVEVKNISDESIKSIEDELGIDIEMIREVEKWISHAMSEKEIKKKYEFIKEHDMDMVYMECVEEVKRMV